MKQQESLMGFDLIPDTVTLLECVIRTKLG